LLIDFEGSLLYCIQYETEQRLEKMFYHRYTAERIGVLTF